ncbi:hypothetical protein NYR97_14885 [Xanthomonas hydrangeae]|uniref:Uncharacterized protein n=1 Tax=Xanthomonas hydrangeae TaxID=2775159 RepID=A0AAU0B998_9XANT|nr:hypothetical protein [Xanthomonas hydrangeae]WOB48527.1 hypothetical protein NYR97_14885 [Xanthomonas hydrangeae]
MASAYELARASHVGVAALQQAAEAWVPVVDVLCVVIQQLARTAQVWQSRLSMVGDAAIELQRRMNAATGPVLWGAQESQDLLNMVHQVTRSYISLQPAAGCKQCALVKMAWAKGHAVVRFTRFYSQCDGS